MTVAELKDLLEDYGDHLEVRVYNESRDSDHKINEVGDVSLNGEVIVTLEF